ncbi:MAG: hypothetical protein LBR36_02600 [Bacteroidales bacterium]|jgi:hypothetical protein|nr:hypothetical protein [Bacteroidales bacterium]
MNGISISYIFYCTTTLGDALTFVAAIIGVFCAYCVANYIYKKESRDREKENKLLQEADNQFFNDNVCNTKKMIEQQIEYLKQYEQDRNSMLTVILELRTDYLQYIRVHNIYKQHQKKENGSTEIIYKLFSKLASLSSSQVFLQQKHQYYINKYNEYEKLFFLYRQLLYFKYYELWNKRSILTEGNATCDIADSFLKHYSELQHKTLNNPQIIDDNQMKDRKLLVSEFVLPLLVLSAKYIPNDIDAIEINQIGQDVNFAFIEMETIEKDYLAANATYMKYLQEIRLYIEKFLQLSHKF